MNKKDSFGSYLRNYGMICNDSNIYEDINKSWIFGINGAEIKNNIEILWKTFFINLEKNNYFCSTPILTSKKALRASGHEENFRDILVRCKKCNINLRIEEIDSKNCKQCFDSYSEPFQRKLMLETDISPNINKKFVFLRPETCQGIFVNFPNLRFSIKSDKFPFGVGQIGKSFRNEEEDTMRNGIFRVREFTQAELEFFVKKDEDLWFDYWKEKAWNFFKKIILYKNESEETSLKKIFLGEKDRAHYSEATLDLYFNYSFGWGEVCSISNRGNYDLTRHSEYSGNFLGIINENGNKIIPKVIEISFGIERLFLAVLEKAYMEREGEKKFLMINPLISPYFAVIIPLVDIFSTLSEEIYKKLTISVMFRLGHDGGKNSIGKKYLNNDLIGTFFCITVDKETETSSTVTLRDRNTTEQIKISVNDLEEYLNKIYKEEFKKFLS